MKFFSLICMVIALSSCGIKGKPLPPLPEEQATAVELDRPAAPSQPLDLSADPSSGTTTSKKKKKTN